MEGISYIDTKNGIASFRKWQIIEIECRKWVTKAVAATHFKIFC